jgi:transcriptional regulator with XRE-family HTH domain
MMIIETIRKQIEKSGLSRYRISLDTGVDQATLSRLMQGKTITVETADILLKYFELEIKPKKKKAKLFAFELGKKTTKVVIGKKKTR